MKKFFSILCALTIVLSASAVPAKTLGLSKQKEAVEVKTVKAHKTLPATRLEKAERAAFAFKAPQAKLENYDVTIVDYAENFYETDNDVWVKLYDADENVYYFDVVVAEGTNELALGQTYTLADMIANYSYMKDATSNKIAYASASLTKSVSMYEEQELVHFAAAFTDTLGNNYTLTYDQAPFIITGDTIDVVFTSMNKPIYSQGLCQMRATDDDNDIAFTFPCAEGAPAGTYAEDDMNLNYTFVNNYEAVSAHCVVADNNGTISLEGWILAGDGNVYHVTMSFTAPTAQTFETINATNLVLDDTYADYLGVIIVEASNENYAVGMYLPSDDYLGTYDAEEVSLGIEGAEGEIEIYEGTITVANTADGVAITGTVLGMNNVQYTLNLTYVIPDATSQETITMSGEITNYGTAWQFMGKTSDKFVTIAAYATSIPGTYGRADLAADYTYVAKFVGADTLYYDMIDANIVVTVSGTNATITGTLKGQNYDDSSDVIEFTLNLTATVEDYEEPAEQGNQYDAQDEGFDYNFPVYTVDDQYLEQYNVFIVEAQDAANNYISIEFNVAAGTVTLPAGVYTVDNSSAPGTVSAGSVDQYIYGSFAGSLDDEGYINIPLWLMVEGTVTVTESGVIEVAATNTWGQSISSRLGEYLESIDNIDANATATKAIRNGQLIIIKNGVKYNAQGAIVK